MRLPYFFIGGSRNRLMENEAVKPTDYWSERKQLAWN